jgi:hypothetical protein
MRYASFVTISLAAAIAAGCGSSSGPDPADAETGGMLRVASAAELEASIKSGFTAPQTIAAADAVAALGGTAAAGGAPGSFTGTYTQEPRVDEFDAVRYDGAHLYVAPQRYLTCCVVTPVTQTGAPLPRPQPAIRILATDPANGTANLVGTIALPDGDSVQGMYVTDGTMFALTSEAFFGTFGGFWMDIAIWAQRRHGFRIYDVHDPAAPVLRHEAQIDGQFVASRRIGDTVYIMSRYTPYVPEVHYYAATPAQRAANQNVLSRVTLAELMPRITIDGVTRPLVEPQRCYVTDDASDDGHAVVTSITAVPIDNPTAFRTTCYNEDTYGVYVSETALYLTELRADTAQRRSFTRIHKIALDGSALTYEGSAEIDGYVWHGGQADFRMSEHDAHLRVFTTELDWSAADVVEHKLYVLRKSPTARQLTIVSQLPNNTNPQEIGKPNEQLFGVRFFGTRAYAVTFQRIDPLYVIDLADPADPRITGHLEVAGVSDFLHPVDDNLLLGLGSAAQGGIKLELFDVSDLMRPLSRGSSILGGSGSYSEAQHDRHAFTYQSDVGGVDRFTIPAILFAETGSHQFVESGLYLFEIRDKADLSRATLLPVGALITDRAGSETPYASRNRSFIHDETVYYIRDEQVWSAFWNVPSAPLGPF